MGRRALALALGVALAGLLAAESAPRRAEHNATAVATYLVGGVRTREQRSAIARTGTDVLEVKRAAVVVRASRLQRRALSRLGFRPRRLAAPFDFPLADAAYHNYAETIAELQSVAAAHPQTAHLLSFGTGIRAARLGGMNEARHRLEQRVRLPASAQLRLWVRVGGQDSRRTDRLRVQLVAGGRTITLGALTAVERHGVWRRLSFRLAAWGGQRVLLRLLGTTGKSLPSTFVVDDVSIVSAGAR